MITGGQIRAARALLGWSTTDTAAKAGLERKTIERLEGSDGVPSGRIQTLAALQAAFEKEGIKFIGEPIYGPGVRLWDITQARKRGIDQP